MTKKFSWKEHTLKRILFGAIGSVIITMMLLTLLNFFTYVVIYGGSWDQFLSQQSVDWYFFGLLITLVMTLIYHAIYFYRLSQTQKVNEQKVIARSATAQFDALKNQLDPHFLFNSLNVLVSLIEENPKAATKFTTSLSKVYRYVLEQRNKELVTVDEELSFARAYVGLLKTRFEDSIEIDIPQKSSNPDMKVVPLSLQLLLENAVKHNVVSDSKPLKLRIYEKDNQLIIENNLQKKQVPNTSSGVGLQNIASRYQLLTKRKMSIAQDDQFFRVQIPILIKSQDILTSNLEDMTPVEDIKLIKAKERVASIKEFYDDVVKTVGILLFLAAINYFTSDFPWVIFPAIGMSIGLVFQYLRTYENNAFLGKGWEDRKIEELMNDKNF
ncbi:putative two-component sensor histidine kinase transcriptional regulator [Flavobacteria bacterium BBFL7]|nr:putative two-component sensor histidine kinase transcriptional regulator [Flavobacteria bacterium BBFL7]